MKQLATHLAFRVALGLFAAGLCGPANAQPAHQKDPDWPCVQVFVPELSAASVWAGPPLDELKADWRSDPKIQGLVSRAAASSSPDALEPEIQSLAEGAGANRDETLALLFKGVYETLNEERSEAIGAIRRYAQQQRAVRERIAANLRQLDALPPEDPKAKGLSDAIAFDRRVLNTRQRALPAVCEQPVLMEQRLGTLARLISYQLQ